MKYKLRMIIIVFLVVFLVIWIAWSYLSVRNIEEPKFKVISENGFYEIREYESYIIAETTVDADFKEGLNEGFRRIAGYIFGGNTKSEKIAMTTPVAQKSVIEDKVSEKIAMTVPVSEKELGDNKLKVWFVMPSEYTLETLPIPIDERVELSEIPAHKVAVHKFGWPITANRVKEKKQMLIEALKKDNIETSDAPVFAGYNPPFSFPLFVRNEVMIEVE